MPDTKGNLYIYEAVALRNQYDAHVELLSSLINNPGRKAGTAGLRDGKETIKPADDYNPEAMEKVLRKLRERRLKLNHRLQSANFSVHLRFGNNYISIAEALETRKALQQEIQVLYGRVLDSAYTTVIHKEERDITDRSRFGFTQSYRLYRNALNRLRRLENAIHQANHTNTVDFKDE